jgi:hypothetical protein
MRSGDEFDAAHCRGRLRGSVLRWRILTNPNVAMDGPMYVWARVVAVVSGPAVGIPMAPRVWPVVDVESAIAGRPVRSIP